MVITVTGDELAVVSCSGTFGVGREANIDDECIGVVVYAPVLLLLLANDDGDDEYDGDDDDAASTYDAVTFSFGIVVPYDGCFVSLNSVMVV